MRADHPAPPTAWHVLSHDQALHGLQSTRQGLTAQQAAQRLARHGILASPF